MITFTIFEELGAEERERIRNYREICGTLARSAVSEDPWPAVKQMIIGDEEFAEQI